MIPKGLKNLAAAFLLLGSTGSMGVGAWDAMVPETCTISTSSDAKDIRTCTDNVDGDAQTWYYGGLLGLGAIAGVNLAFPNTGNTGPAPGNPSPTQRETSRRRRGEDES